MAIVSHVETDDFYDKFYVEAKVLLVEDADHAEIQLEDAHLRLPVRANPLRNRPRCWAPRRRIAT